MIIDCKFSFKRQDFSLEFKHRLVSKKITCLMGKSGSGKTTLMRLMLGLERSKNNKFMVDEQIYQDESIFVKTEDRNICYAGQNSCLLPFYTLKANLAFVEKRAKEPSQALPDLKTLLEIFELTDCINKKPHEFSAGQKQRAYLLQALYNNSELYLLDEALSAVDNLTKNTILEFLIEYFIDNNKAVIYISHDFNEIEFIQNRTEINLINLDKTLS